MSWSSKVYILDLIRNVFAKFGLKDCGERLSLLVISLVIRSSLKSRSVEQDYERIFSLQPSPKLPSDVINVFVYWDAGFEQAPDVVKKCYESLHEQLDPKDFSIIPLDSSNLHLYITLPNLFLERHCSGALSTTHLSDVIRSLLVLNYGGIWFDATLFLSKSIPSPILQHPLFLFRTTSAYKQFSNQFIAHVNPTPTSQAVLRLLLLCLYRYWENLAILLSYAYFHYILTLVFEALSCQGNMPYYSALQTHILQHHALGRQITETQLQHLVSSSFLHKLTYKKKLLTSNGLDILAHLVNPRN